MTLSVGDTQRQSTELIDARYCHLINSYDLYSHWTVEDFRSKMPLGHDRHHSFYTWFSFHHIWQHPRVASAVARTLWFGTIFDLQLSGVGLALVIVWVFFSPAANVL